MPTFSKKIFEKRFLKNPWFLILYLNIEKISKLSVWYYSEFRAFIMITTLWVQLIAQNKADSWDTLQKRFPPIIIFIKNEYFLSKKFYILHTDYVSSIPTIQLMSAESSFDSGGYILINSRQMYFIQLNSSLTSNF